MSRWTLVLLSLAALPAPVGVGADAAAGPPCPPFPIWPLPREARVAEARLLLTEATIVVPAGAARAQVPGRLLAEIVADEFGVALPVVVGAAPPGRTPIVVGEAAAVAEAVALLYFARPLVAGKLPDGRAAVVWASEWANPRPDVEIASVTLVGSPGPTNARPLLLGVTAVEKPRVEDLR